MSSKPKNFTEAIDELGRFAGQAGDDLKSKVERELHNLEETIQKLKPQLEDLQKTASEEAAKAKSKIEQEVSKNPLAAIGIAGLVFFILGFLFASRGGKRND